MELAATHTIRFSAMHSATTRVLQLYPAVLVALKDVCKRREDFDAAVRAESEGLLKRFSDFETFITLMMFNKIFDIVGPLNTFLQTSGLDLALCVAEADIAEAKLQTLRDSRSNNIICDAKVKAETLEIATQFKENRLRRKKRLFDDEGADEQTSDPNEQWINEVFLTAIDTAQAILKEKFSGQRPMLLSLSAFLPTSFCDVERITEEHVGKFIDQFKLDISAESLTAELRQFAELCTHNKTELVTVREKNSFCEAYSYILEKRLDSVFSHLPLAYRILATIPTSSMECERTFSKLKIIKDRLANKITSEHLSDRMILSTEQDLMWKLDYMTIIRRYSATSTELTKVLFPV